MDLATIPVLSLDDDPDRFSGRIGESFRQFGFAMVCDHGLAPDLVDRSWLLAKEFFALPLASKRAWQAGEGGARGYVPFGTEIAKGASIHDLKEFWHIGRDLPAGHRLERYMPPNVWPDRPQGFRETFTALYAEFDRVGALILSRIANHLQLPGDWFDPAIADGNSVLRLLHYPPIENAPEGAVRAQAHGDINLITLLLGAEEAGLELLTRQDTWLPVDPPQGALVVNIGDMLERLTNHVLPSTTHRVRNPDGERARHSRFAMPFFLHLRSDFIIRSLDRCVTADNPDRYPEPITANDFLQQRLMEIGLKG